MIDLKGFRYEKGLSPRDIVDVVRLQYPGFDRSLCSKVENSERYGVRLVYGAEVMVEEIFGNHSANGKKRDLHRLRRRVQCRLPDAKYEALQRKLKNEGYETVQDLVNDLINKYLGE